MKYNIFYKDVKIGVLEINDEGKHKYTPDDNGVETIKDDVSLFLLEKTEWTDPIPFFQNRINDAKKFSHEEDIRSHSAFFRMVKITD